MRVKNTNNMVDLHIARCSLCPRGNLNCQKIPLCEHGAKSTSAGAERNMAVSKVGAEVREQGGAEGQKWPK